MLTTALEEDEDFDMVVVERVDSLEELAEEEDDDEDEDEEELAEDELEEEDPDAEDDPLLADIASLYS